MAVKTIAHPSIADRRAKGVDARETTPPSNNAGWVPATDRPDPVALLQTQDVTRISTHARGPRRGAVGNVLRPCQPGSRTITPAGSLDPTGPIQDPSTTQQGGVVPERGAEIMASRCGLVHHTDTNDYAPVLWRLGCHGAGR